MAKKPPKFLIETSVCMAALGATTTKRAAHLQGIVGSGRLFSSVYLRMEFIRRYICSFIRMAMIANQCRTVADALTYLAQDFHARSVKIGYVGLGEYWANVANATTSAELAEEFAHVAINLLERYDEELPSKIANACRCEIGGKSLAADYNSWREDLPAFHADFSTPVQNCAVNGFLKLDNSQSNANVLINDAKAVKCSAVAHLKSFRDQKQWITCEECKKIGDAVIALEQPPSWNLVHGDKHSFPVLCTVLHKKETYVTSVQALEHADPNFVWKV